MLLRGKGLIAPFHECLRNEDGVQAIRKSNDLSLERFLTAIPLYEDTEINHTKQPLADFGK